MNNNITNRTCQSSVKPTYRSVSYAKDHELTTSISTFSNNIMTPKFIKDLAIPTENIQENCYSTSINPLPAQKELRAFKKFNKKVSGNSRMINFHDNLEEKNQSYQENFLKKDKANLNKKIKNKDRIIIENQEINLTEFPELHFDKFFSTKKRQPDLKNHRKRSSISNFLLMNNNPSRKESNSSYKSSSKEEFSLKSLNEASVTERNRPLTLTSSSIQNRFFDDEDILGKDSKFKSLVLLDDGKFQQVDLKEVLTHNEEHKGILKFRNLKSRNKVMKLKKLLKVEQGDGEDGEHIHVHFGRYLKVYNYNPKKKVKFGKKKSGLR